MEMCLDTENMSWVGGALGAQSMCVEGFQQHLLNRYLLVIQPSDIQHTGLFTYVYTRYLKGVTYYRPAGFGNYSCWHAWE
jgi:hypothetical protein